MKATLDFLQLRALRAPREEALVFGEERLDAATLAAQARAIAGALVARGIGEGDRVAVAFAAETRWVALAHAVRSCGASLLPVNTRLTAPERADQLARAAPRLVIEDADAVDALARDGGERAAPLRLPLDAEASLLFTSGTSGRPRGARLSLRAHLASAVGAAVHLGVGPTDRWLACLPLFHVGGLAILHRTALLGGAMVLHSGFDTDRVVEDLEREAITIASLVPTTLKRVLDARGDRRAPETLRCVLLGGAAAPPGLVARARALGWPIAPTYGLTETASQVVTALPGDAPLDVGTPLFGAELRIVAPDGRPCVAGEPGEIAVRGPMCFDGYLDDPEEGCERIRDGFFHTGDEGVLDDAGRLRVLDRRSDLIVCGGENVYPAEVEAALLDHAEVAEVAVVGLPDAEWGARVAAYLVPKPGAKLDPVELEAFARVRLAGYKVPRSWHSLDALPRNATGKVMRRELALAARDSGE